MKLGWALIVDDDAQILELLEMRLEAMGLQVVTAGNHRDALRALEAQSFDVALFDLRMDPLNGIALMEAAHIHQPGLPVLIMTAYGTIETAVDAVQRGAFDYLTKPFAAGELRSKLGRALSARRWARDRNLLRTIGETLASSDTAEHMLEAVARGTVEATQAEDAVVFLQDHSALRAAASAGAAQAPGRALETAARAAIDRGAPTAVTGPDGAITLAAPLLVGGGLAGALVVDRPGTIAPTDEELELLAVLASQAAAALRNAQELARLRGGAMAALGRIGTEVAHELRNPLGGLKLYARHLEKRLADSGDDESREIAEKIGRGIDHLTDLVTKITTYGRAPALRREPTRLAPLLAECVALAQDRVVSKEAQVIHGVPDGLPVVEADPRELKKVFLNLILNGLDAMENGGTLTLTGAHVGESEVTITVADTGCGMSPEIQARIFDPFFTTKVNGTGLGMAIARSVVHVHGGRLVIDSEPARGTRVSVHLPVVRR